MGPKCDSPAIPWQATLSNVSEYAGSPAGPLMGFSECGPSTASSLVLHI